MLLVLAMALSLGGAVLTVAGLALSEWEPRKEGSKGGVE